MKNILFVSYDGLCDNLGQSQILPYLIELSEYGFLISVVSLEKQAFTCEEILALQIKLKDSNITWKFRHYDTRRPFKNILNLIRNIQEVTSSTNVDVFHARGYIPCFVSLLFKILYGTRVIFDARGLWFDERIELLNNNVSIRLLNQMKYLVETTIFRLASDIVFLTTNSLQYVKSSYRIQSSKLHLVSTSISNNFVDQCKDIPKELDDYLRKDDKLRVVYCGSLGGHYPVDKLLSLFKSIGVEDKKLIVLTGQSCVLTNYLTVHEIELDFFAIKVPHNRLHAILDLCDLGLIFYRDGLSNIARSPTKLAEYWISGLPVLYTGKIGDLSNIKIEASNALNDSWEKLELQGLSEHQRAFLCEKYFSFNKTIGIYIKLYNR